ncbi:MAG: hypothetical protein ACR5KV_04710 [Wolbachia sp.]
MNPHISKCIGNMINLLCKTRQHTLTHSQHSPYRDDYRDRDSYIDKDNYDYNKWEKKIKELIDQELKLKLNCDLLKSCGLEETSKEIIDDNECNRRGCENSKQDGNYINVSHDGKFYIRKALNIIYPDLNTRIIDKIETNDCYVKQFGIVATRCDKNGMEHSLLLEEKYEFKLYDHSSE